MPKITVLVLGLLACYSGALIGIEMQTSQDFARHFFTDIEGPVPFYAVNTTLSVSLLWTTAVLFAIGAACTRGLPQRGRLHAFFISQVFIFFWLGMDDRFKFHEHLAWRLGIADHFVLLAIAVMEVGFLCWLGGRAVLRAPFVYSLAAAAGLFAVMVFFDACVPHRMLLRLTLEDLAKTWANLCFVYFAWQLCRAQIDDLKSARQRELASACAC